MPLTYYWDEEDYEAGPRTISGRERESITAEAPSAAPTVEQSFHSYDRERGIALHRYGPSAVSLFWWIFLVLVSIGGLISLVSGPTGLLIGGVIILLVLPGLQVGAAILTTLFVATSSRPDKRYQFRQLAKIFLGTVAGTILGILVMVGLFILFNAPEFFRSGNTVWVIFWMVVGAVVVALSVLGLVALSRR
jgi:hypothetical protein